MDLPTHLQLNIVTPDRALVDEQVDEVEIPGSVITLQGCGKISSS